MPHRTTFNPNNGHSTYANKAAVYLAKNMKTIVCSENGAKVSTKINGKVKKISKLEAAVLQLVNKAAGGDLKAIEKLIALYERYGPEEQSVVPTAEETKVNFEVLQNYLTLKKLFNDDIGGKDDIASI